MQKVCYPKGQVIAVLKGFTLNRRKKASAERHEKN